MLDRGRLDGTVILSDDAGQFNVGRHALCWVHAERLIHKLDAFCDRQRREKRRGSKPGSGGSTPTSKPIGTNGSENDIRACVTRRKISAGTRSEAGKQARDIFLGLMKTCKKLEISFWHDLGNRLKVPDAPGVMPLPILVRQRCKAMA